MITADNLGELDGLHFVFVCVDKGAAKKAFFEKLEGMKISFVDVGMGIETAEESLLGILRVTTSTESSRAHIYENSRVSFSDGDDDDEYARNIQIAELNALCAALAVIKWKKLCGFYQDFENEHHSTYTMNVNMLLSDDCAS